MGNVIIAVIGYGAAISFALAAVLGFGAALATKSGSSLHDGGVKWWICGAILALLFAGMTRAMLAGCPA